MKDVRAITKDLHPFNEFRTITIEVLPTAPELRAIYSESVQRC